MKLRMRGFAGVGMLAGSLLLGGCEDEKILEKVAFMRTIAYDTAGEGEEELLKVAISIPVADRKQSLIYSAIAGTTEEAKLAFNRESHRKIVKGQLRQVLLSDRLARKGVRNHIDYLIRDPSVGSRVHVLVVDGDPERLMSATYPNQQISSGEYIDSLIRAEASLQDVPDTNLYTFIRDYYDDGIEPVATIIKQTSKSIMIGGIALFKADRMVARVEPENKMLLGMLRRDLNAGEMYLDLSGGQKHGEQATISFISSSRKVTVKGPIDAEHSPQVALSFDIKGSLLEYTGGREIADVRAQEQLERNMAKEIEKKCRAVIRIMQESKTDCIGLGQYARNRMSYAEWSRLDWNETFAKADIRLEVNVRINNYGKLQ